MPPQVFNSRLLWLSLFGLIFLMSGCVPSPKYSSDLTAAMNPATTPFSDVTLEIIPTNNTITAEAYMKKMGETQMVGWAIDPHAFGNALNTMLNSRFARVVRTGAGGDPNIKGEKISLLLDMKVKVGASSGEITSIALQGVFKNRKGRKIDNIAVETKESVPYPNITNRFTSVMNGAVSEFAKELDSSSALIAYQENPSSLKAAVSSNKSGGENSRVYQFPVGQANPNAIAIIVGNRRYQHKDVPEVSFAENDAAAVKQFLIQSYGFSERNVVTLTNATQSGFFAHFGTGNNVKGRLYDMVRPQQSDVFVFYSGHGVPGENRSGYLLPTDADPGKPELTGYSIDLLVQNLGKIRARSVIVALDTCFSGLSDGGVLIRDASPVFIAADKPKSIPRGTLLTAANGRQIASWDRDVKLGLFTRYLLTGLLGEADNKHGNQDGQVSTAELGSYLASEVTYRARRQFGRDQNPQVIGDQDRILLTVPTGNFKGF